MSGNVVDVPINAQLGETLLLNVGVDLTDINTAGTDVSHWQLLVTLWGSEAAPPSYLSDPLVAISGVDVATAFPTYSSVDSTRVSFFSFSVCGSGWVDVHPLQRGLPDVFAPVVAPLSSVSTVHVVH